ncbi:GNAT family N-acetyltransferase [Undibacterium cyanobacteriorum]|uniref:GNAT family N-acetyltransferase n=1 Tax=Undibacterium cyanobacteriorum TaxID=3073561 RepID=A0ABY9RMQ3_9BURK|nr:GNAT family N-acetyltransferase [Undibacterium sp. 20NA77.5]WMW82099.1 GNAT family N-acetyltransferase [Undibacterium sp. 20NA77.5]
MVEQSLQLEQNEASQVSTTRQPQYQLRPIKEQDNAAIAAIIRAVFVELDAPREGSAYSDPSLDGLYQHYQADPRAAYFVVEIDGKVIAGCGLGPLPGEPSHVCELQKMYMTPECRGLGIGQRLVQACLDQAKEFAYTQCYLETLPNMTAAQALYLKFGFRYLERPLGNTGHSNCPVWMLLDLEAPIK